MSSRQPADHVRRVGAREGYDLWADSYDHTPNPVVAMDARHTLAALDARPGERILDAGCGTGRHLCGLLETGARAVGVDFSSGMLGVARRGLPDAVLAAAGLEAGLPFARASFDAALCALVGEHIQDLDAAFGELARVIRPAGRLVFSVYHPWMAAAGIEANFRSGDTEFRLGARAHTLADYRRGLARAGFHGIEITEHAADTALAERVPAARKYVGRPLLVILRAGRDAASGTVRGVAP